VRDGSGREVEHELHEPVAVTRIDAPEHRALEPPARRHEVEPGDGFDVATCLEELRHASAQVSTHARDENSHCTYEGTRSQTLGRH
jgi:hypothetical protein